MSHLAAETLISGAGGGAIILPAGGAAFAAGAALAAGFFAGALPCTVCLLSHSMTPSYLGVSPQMHTTSEDPCFAAVQYSRGEVLGQ